jgi:hypothetical protein
MNASIRRTATIVCLVIAAPFANAADSSAPSHSCRKPGKAAEIKTQQEADKFNEVSKYKSCIEDFVRQQEDAAMNHRRVANEAISEWNDFVTNDMKQ